MEYNICKQCDQQEVNIQDTQITMLILSMSIYNSV